MSIVLVINSGSSSFKYQLIRVDDAVTLASGLVERIGEAQGATKHVVDGLTFVTEQEVSDHRVGFQTMIEAFETHGPSLEDFAPIAVGHRVVHGGKRFFEPTVITDLVKINIADISELAPLHNPAALEGIDAAQTVFSRIPHVAIFDTAFHQTLPESAYRYAIDHELADRYRIRRYGFHGTSHKYVSQTAAEFLDVEFSEINQIVLHLGNGASACAIRGGRSVDTSMGMTPLEGLVMGTRSGDIDPAVLFHLHRKAGMGFAELDSELNRRSGILGMSGTGDMRDLVSEVDSGNQRATSAFEVYIHRIKHYIGAYFAQLGRVDTVVFTAGVGENNALVRSRAVSGLEQLGIVVDDARNESLVRGQRVISTDDSPVTVLVIPTNEELEIARQSLSAVDATYAG